MGGVLLSSFDQIGSKMVTTIRSDRQPHYMGAKGMSPGSLIAQ